MFGKQLLDHDDRYGYTEEWVTIVKRIWSETEPFDFSGKHFDLKNVGGKPKPYGGSAAAADERGLLAGRPRLRRAPCRLPVHGDRRRGQAGRRGRQRPRRPQRHRRLSPAAICCAARRRRKPRTITTTWSTRRATGRRRRRRCARRLKGDTRSLPHDKLHTMMERFISGGGTFPVIGSYDEVAAKLKRLSDAGLDGMALASVNYVQEMPHHPRRAAAAAGAARPARAAASRDDAVTRAPDPHAERQQVQAWPVRHELLRLVRHHGAGALAGRLGRKPRSRAAGRRGRAWSSCCRSRAGSAMAARPTARAPASRPCPGRRRCWPRPTTSSRSRPSMCRWCIRCSPRNRSSPPTMSGRGGSASTSCRAGTSRSSRCSAFRSASTTSATTIPPNGCRS